MALCFCSMSHGGPGTQQGPYLHHIWYCEMYGDDIYDLSADDALKSIKIIEMFALKYARSRRSVHVP